jgi:hypothetical protein
MGKVRAQRPLALTVFFWVAILSVPVIAMVIGIGYMSYWTIPTVSVLIEGDPLFVYDREIGYVARPNSSSKWTVLGTDGKPTLQYSVHTDRRGARVANRGDQGADRADILIVGDSFTWGHGVEGHETFAFKTMSALGKSGANLALASYGTTHSLQMMRRNRDLKPSLVIFPLTRDHLWRNVSACGRSYYSFCLDYSHVAWDAKGEPYIATPRSDGITRVQRQARAQREHLDPVTWIVHGLDVVIAQVRFKVANAIAVDRVKQDVALEFLIRQMALSASEMNASLLIAYLPDESMSPSPEMLARSAQTFGYRFLDLSNEFLKLEPATRSQLYLPKDGHPNAAGHALMAQELIAFIRRENLLPR